jgi:hypothetical protein
MAHERKKSKIIEELHKRWEENPIVEELPEEPVPDITKEEHIKELQELLVQTCIDYINKNGLTDIYAVRFSADSLNESAEYGSWQSCTDSYIKIEGLKMLRLKRKDGDIFEMPERYDIGEYM